MKHPGNRVLIYRRLCYGLLIFVMICSLASCKKKISPDNVFLQQYFEQNVLGREFVITLAKDHDQDITADYKGYIFKLVKDDFYHGPLEITRAGSVYEGTWRCDEDFGKLTITLPDSPAEFAFIDREWRFTSKDLPVLKLTPWVGHNSAALNLTRQ